MKLNDLDGHIESIKINDKEFVKNPSPLFTIQLRNKVGDNFDFSSTSNKFKIKKMDSWINMFFTIDNLGSALVKAYFSDQQSLSYWRINITINDPKYIIEWIEFPSLIVPNDLIQNGGKSKLLWPGMEGVLIEDIEMREKNEWLRYKPLQYPNRGWEGYFPGPTQLQFMAYYDDNESGLYFGAHDPYDNVKEIEFHKEENGIKLEFRVFPGSNDRNYSMNYDMVLGAFKGDWHDAAEIYRNWFTNFHTIEKNSNFPNWIDDSPIVVIYPVRGTKDTGDMKPNNEYFPYKNGIEHIDKISKLTSSKVLALLMHWEGTAPWAPPYVWPPFGGEQIFIEFINEMHKRGHLVGVYCSGTAWTNESLLVHNYNMKSFFEKQNLSKVMCVGPKGEMKSLICNGTQRWGYDMCISTDFVKKTSLDEIAKIVRTNIDYIQFFDQNLGGASYFCYSEEHDHPPVPGIWLVKETKFLLEEIEKMLKDLNVSTLIGCEAAAAEPFISKLKFNDLRFNINFFFGRPVPLYNYIFHEFVRNFMGNQNSSAQSIDINKSPNNLLYRLAYSFTYGDIMTVVLRDNGNINWDWGTDWNVEPPNQDLIINLIKNLNFIRKNAGNKYLTRGKMLKPDEVQYDSKNETLYLRTGNCIEIPALLVSKWEVDGKIAEIITNYNPRELTFSIKTDKKVSNVFDSFGNIFHFRKENNNFKIAPLSALVIEFEN